MMTSGGQPKTEPVRAGDVKPYEWSLWCRVEGSEPFANEIVAVKPIECGEYLSFMLDSFNFMKVNPDEVLYLIPNGKKP